MSDRFLKINHFNKLASKNEILFHFLSPGLLSLYNFPSLKIFVWGIAGKVDSFLVDFILAIPLSLCFNKLADNLDMLL